MLIKSKSGSLYNSNNILSVKLLCSVEYIVKFSDGDSVVFDKNYLDGIINTSDITENYTCDLTAE